ncbi:CAP domain-containing protein [Streptomyces sp. NBC_00028]|uniref:CAP domain-containing protein n=1 Tax=Streptomyces sp. NBC_00028 TaxID=2975624 RepID=UPI0032475675
MGRHRRSAAGRAATGRATGVTETDGSYTSGYDPQDSYNIDQQDPYGVDQQHAYGIDQQFSYDFEADARGPHTGEYPTMGIAPYLNPEAHSRSDAYLYATNDEYARTSGTAMFPSEGFSPDDGPRRGGSRRRRKKRVVTPVKTGLLGVSAAVAIGTVAVATGVVPGLDNYKLGGGSGADKVQAADTPTNSATEQGGTSGSADDSREDEAASRGGDRTASPTPTPSASASTAAPTKTPSKEATKTPTKEPKATPTRTATKAPQNTTAPGITVSAEAQAEAEVLKLVNEERAKVGCSAVSANSALGKLAEDFSDAMAAEGFFDHTDPSGRTPWDRAEAAGISNLGGENIARGQADAAAVMEAWMNSPGHKANILNCDFKTLGVGVHFGFGGPWWTQDFGY